MAKRKRRRKSRPSLKRPSRKLMRELTAAMELFEEGDADAAKKALLPLIATYPRSKPVLFALLEVSNELKDWHTVAFCSEYLLPLEQGNDQADILNNLVYAHTKLLYPALVWHYAHELATKHPNFNLIEQMQSLIDITEPTLLQEAAAFLDTTSSTDAEKLHLMVQHDRVRFYTESGHPEAAIPVAESFLEKVPDVIPILNNLSLSQFMVGDVEQAKTAAQKVVQLDADNFHALSNLTRFAFLTGQLEQARQFADRLQQVSNDNPDLATKQAEALAFLGDDEGIRAIYEEQANLGQGDLNPLLLHLAAVAYYRLGDQKNSWSLWRKSIKQAPSMEMAQACLAERPLPVSERNIPWYWPFQYWFTNDFQQLFKKFGIGLAQKSNKGIKREMRALLAKRPFLPKLFPHMLERGDRTTREFVLNAIYISETPQLLQILYDFSLSQHGTDDKRMEAIQFISQHHPEMLPENKQVLMWRNGQQTKLVMMSFEITNEPDWVDTTEEVLDMHDTTYELILNEEIDAAEPLLNEIIAADPDFCSAYNQLALVYEMQGRTEEARALVEETHARFPDYLFARVGLARILTQEKRVEEAKDLLNPIMRQTKLHITEFRALARANMDISLAEDRKESARSWLEMWRQMEDDNPELMQWQMRIDGPDGLLKKLKNML